MFLAVRPVSMVFLLSEIGSNGESVNLAAILMRVGGDCSKLLMNNLCK